MSDIVISGKGFPVSSVHFRSSIADFPAFVSGKGPLFIVYDLNASSYAEAVASAVSPVSVLGINVSEDTKTIETVSGICSWLLEKGADRNAVLVAVGGGILTDMAGFAAAIYKRGIEVAYVPTTLLAQVDASVGGKTGVNFQSYKNILGVIRQPLFTFICPEVLTSLPYSHILEGAAEMIKTFIIKDGGNYRRAVSFFSRLAESGDRQAALKAGAETLGSLVRAAVSVKAEIVSADQFENGVRRKLNLGHTFAHAIEWRSHSISHGQAVSVGIVCAARLSAALGLCPGDLPDMLAGDLGRCGLETALPFRLADLHDAMLKDKKAEDGSVRFVLIRGIGDTDVVSLTVDEALAALS